MKKLLLSGLLIGLTASAFAQGQVAVRNIFNGATSPTATSDGRVFLNGVLINQDFNLQFYGGASSGNLSLLFTYSGAAATGINAAGPGTFFTSDIGTIPGATATGFFRIDAWIGAPDFASAATRGTTGEFSNPLGNPNANPPATPAELTGMPSINLTAVPEPGTFALAGLGAAALLIFRRRK